MKYSTGNSVAGGCIDPASACATIGGNNALVDYSLMLKYENPDQDFDFGMNFIRRIAGGGQNLYQGFGGTGTGMNFNTFDFYTRKRLGSLSFGLEVPIVNGTIGAADYSAWSAAGEVDWEVSNRFELGLKFGHASGQPSFVGTEPDRFRAFFFHPSYNLGLIMFNYALHNFHGPNTLNDPTTTAADLASPFDNPIVNANYASLGGGYTLGKWQLRTMFVFANALETAQEGSSFYNTWTRRVEQVAAGAGDQAASLGWEMDYGVTFRWDDSFQFHFDLGWFFPGDFYKFSNVAGEPNSVSPVFATSFKAGVNF